MSAGNDMQSFLKGFDIEAIGPRKLVLVDDYAEARTFKKILKFLNDNRLVFSIERRTGW